MRAYRTAVFALSAFALGAYPVAAQEGRSVEVTPYVGMGVFGPSTVGTAVTFPVSAHFSVESDTAYRRGEGHLNLLSTSVSLLWFPPRIGRVEPYLAAGVGLAQYGAPIFSLQGRPIGTQTGVALTTNVGGGMKVPMSERLDLRTDARLTTRYGRYGSDQFRIAQGVSFDVRKK